MANLGQIEIPEGFTFEGYDAEIPEGFEVERYAGVPEEPEVPEVKPQPILEKMPRWEDIQKTLPEDLQKYGNDIKNGLSIAATHDLELSKAYSLRPQFEEQYEEKELWKKAKGSFVAGIGDVYTTAGSTMRWLGFSDEDADIYADFGERLRMAYIPPSDPSEFTWDKLADAEWWATSGSRAVPFTLSLIPAAIVGAYAGVGVATALGYGTFGVTVLAAIGGASLSRPVESAFEAGGVYDEAIAKGMTEDEANRAADKVFWGNMALTGVDAAQFALSFTPMRVAGKGAQRALLKRILATIGKFGAVALSEAAEERYQETIAGKAIGEETRFLNFKDPRLNEASALGAIFGMGMAGTGSVWTGLTEHIKGTAPSEVRKIYDDMVTTAIEGGATAEQAELQALDGLAETPEGKAHIEVAVGDLKNIAEGKALDVEDVTGKVGRLREFFTREEVTGIEIDETIIDKAILDLIIEGKEIETLTDEDIMARIEALGVPVSPEAVEGVPEVVPEAKPPTEVKRIVSDETYEAARERIKEKLKGLKVGIDPTILPDLVITGAYHIETGLRTFSEWSKQMISRYGDKIKPHLRNIWKQSNDYLKAQIPTRRVKGQIRQAVGIKKISKMISEDKALAAAWKKAEQSARIAMREGRKEGVANERARMKDLLRQAQERATGTAQINKLKDKILKDIKTAKPKKVAGKPVGKFTADIQVVLDRFREAINMTQEQAEAKIVANLEKYEGKVFPDNVGMENRILDIVLRLKEKTVEGGATPLRKRFTVEELTTLLSEIKALKEEGRMLTELRKFNRESRHIAMREDAIDVATGGKGLPGGLKATGVEQIKPPKKEYRAFLSNFTNSLGIHFVGWNDILDMLSAREKKSDPGRSRLNEIAEVHTTENAEKDGTIKATQQIADLAKEAFDFKTDRDMLNQFNLDAKNIEIGKFTTEDGAIVNLKMTKAEARKFVMEYSDPTLRDSFHIGMGFTDDMVKAVFDTLTDKDMAFVVMQMDFYKSYYDRVNAVYRDIYGADLPFNEFYSPIRREGLTEPEGMFGAFLEEIAYRRQVTTGSLKARVENLHRIARQSDVNVLEWHIGEMEHFVAWSEKIRDLNAIFKNPSVRAAIKLHHSPSMLYTVDILINNFTRGKNETSTRLNWLDKFRGNFTRSVLAAKGVITIKQLTSTIAYTEVMPVTDFVAGVADFWKHPVKNFRFLKKNSVWFANRNLLNMERDIKTAMRMKEYSSYRKGRGFFDSLMLNVAIGDQGAIAIGGWAYYKYLTEKQKMPHEQAILEFEKFSENTQQSADLSIQSHFQQLGSTAKLFSMFLSAPNLYFRKELGAIRNLLAGRGSTMDHVKTLVIYQVVIPMFFQLVADAFNWDEDNQKRAVILGPLNGLFLIGEGIEHLVSKAVGARAYTKEIAILTVADDFGKFITEGMKLIAEGDLTDEEFYRAVRGLMGAIGAFTGLPLKQAVDQLKTGSDFVDGEFEKALKGVVGYSPYLIEKQGKARPKRR